MNARHDEFQEYRRQLELGTIQTAYKRLMEYILGLRTHISKLYPTGSVSGSLYYGYLDMTYFAINTAPLKRHQLKIAVVFLHREFRFEIWLSGVNKQVQGKYWQIFHDRGWDKYRLGPAIKGSDSIIAQILVDEPDFRDPAALTAAITTGTVGFVQDVENFLATL